MRRELMSNARVDAALITIKEKTCYRLKEKGRMSYAGPHETYGIIAEEIAELLDAVRANDAEQLGQELLDIAVACAIGIASVLPADTPAR